MRAVFAGTPQFAVPALEALRRRHDVAGVLTQPDRPSGRGRQLSASAVKAAAAAAGLPVAQPATLREDAVRAQLAEWAPDVLVVVAYGLLVPPALLGVPRFGALNIHASLLPRWRGAAPIQRAILAGDQETGVSIMQMDAGLDTGPILLRRRIPIRPDHTGGSLQEELAGLGAAALLEALDGLASGSVRAEPQPAEGVTYAAKIAKAEGRIDWSRPAIEIERQVRAFDPWPVAEARLAGEPLRILAARAVTGASPAPGTAIKRGEDASKMTDHGTIIGVHDGSILVRCGEGILAVSAVQRAGRRPVTAAEFARSVDLSGQQLG